MNKIQYFVIHCTQTPFDRSVTADDIRHWHTDPIALGGRGWSKVGYTSLVQQSGLILPLNDNNEDSVVDPWEITNGVLGINSVSRHIVYSGGIGKNGLLENTMTKNQKSVLVSECLRIISINPDVMIAGHNQFSNKLCPCFDVRKEFNGLIPDKNIYKKSPFYYT